jgi:hypothetical protein
LGGVTSLLLRSSSGKPKTNKAKLSISLARLMKFFGLWELVLEKLMARRSSFGCNKSLEQLETPTLIDGVVVIRIAGYPPASFFN